MTGAAVVAEQLDLPGIGGDQLDIQTRHSAPKGDEAQEIVEEAFRPSSPLRRD